MRASGVLLAIAGHPACGGSKSPVSPSPTPTPPVTPPGDVSPLREAAMSAGKLVGAAVQSSFLSDPRYAEILDRHFNYVTAVVRETVGPSPDQ
jgi:hypothetical protein